MRYAILSDIHGNKQAWDVFLADIAGQSIDSVICLGDIIGYGPKPQAVLDGVRETCAAIVLGNHDAAVCGRLDIAVFNDHARTVIGWTRERLEEFDFNFLLEVPLAVEGGDDIIFVHAEVTEPGRFDYVANEEEAEANFKSCQHRLIFCGHTHKPCVFVLNGDEVSRIEEGEISLEVDKRYLINVGSAGEPREADDLRGRYVIYDSDQETLSYRALEFDLEAYREDLRREGLEIKPFFLRAADFMNGVRTQALVPELQAMSRSPVVPASKSHRTLSHLQVIEVGKRQVGPALIVSVLLVALLLAGAAYLVWPDVLGAKVKVVENVEEFAGDAAKNPPEEEWDLSEGKAMPAALSRNNPESAKSVHTTSSAVQKSTLTHTQASDRLPPVSEKVAASEPLSEAEELKDGVFAVLISTRNFNAPKGPYKVNPEGIGKPEMVKGKVGLTGAFSPDSGLVYGKKEEHGVSGKGMSISFWYHPNNPQKQVKHMAGTASPGKILETGGWSVYAGREALGMVVGDGTQTARVESPLGQSGKVVPWRHVVAIVDLESKRARLYKNGSHAGEVDLSLLSTEIPARNPLTIGVDPEGEGIFHYWGKIDEVAIWKRPLSATEIEGLFKEGGKNKGISDIIGI